jgi:hypothetical protein
MTESKAVRVALRADTTAYVAALGRATAAMTRLTAAYRASLRRDPFARPAPLRIDGHEYHRRRRSRRGRR